MRWNWPQPLCLHILKDAELLKKPKIMLCAYNSRNCLIMHISRGWVTRDFSWVKRGWCIMVHCWDLMKHQHTRGQNICRSWILPAYRRDQDKQREQDIFLRLYWNHPGLKFLQRCRSNGSTAKQDALVPWDRAKCAVTVVIARNFTWPYYQEGSRHIGNLLRS